MKKLKLSLQRIEGAEVLSREQLKKITGGYEEGSWITGSGDDSGKCSTAPCKLVVQSLPETPLGSSSFVTYHGTCAGTTTCYCNTAYYNTTAPVTSNGGVSRCAL